MEHDSSRSGYHEPEPGYAGQDDEFEDDWGDDYQKTFSINLIWAQGTDTEGRSGAIGFNGGMPWHLAEDLRRFKELTVSHPVIMGRRTWESLPAGGRPLESRDNIVVSHDPRYVARGASVVSNVEDALDLARQEAIPDDGLDRSEIWVIGGAQIFREALPEATKIYITQIDTHVQADTFAPDINQLLDSGQWELTERTGWKQPEGKRDTNVGRYRFLTLERRGLHDDDPEEE